MIFSVTVSTSVATSFPMDTSIEFSSTLKTAFKVSSLNTGAVSSTSIILMYSFSVKIFNVHLKRVYSYVYFSKLKN